MGHWPNVRDKAAFLRRLMEEFAGGRMSLEGDLSKCASPPKSCSPTKRKGFFGGIPFGRSKTSSSCLPGYGNRSPHSETDYGRRVGSRRFSMSRLNAEGFYNWEPMTTFPRNVS